MTNPLLPALHSLIKKNKHFLSTLWKVIRQDGVEFNFTDHTSEIIFGGSVFTPTDGVNASARRKEVGFEPSNLEIIGIISDDTITHDDLRGGLFINAEVKELVIDYRMPYLGAVLANSYWITETRFNVERWEAKVEGVKRFLKPPIGSLYVRDCRHDLGDSICLVDVVGLSENGTIFALAGSGQTERAFFEVAGLTEPDQFFTFGRVTWITGNNTGLKSQVKNHLVSGTTTIELFQPLPFAPVVNDQFNIEPGCDKLRDTCISKFDNIINHGGFTFIPSADRIIQTPEIK